MSELPVAENQRFAQPKISQALEDALSGVAAGSLEPLEALETVQKVADALM